MSTIYVIRDGGTTESMARVRCKDEERELQRLLELNHDLLPGDQIDPEDPRRWVLIQREMPVEDPNTGHPRWSIDFLFADQDAVPTFVECKRFADTRSRREVVGQMLEYAANGHHYWSDQTLRSFAEATARSRGSTLESLLEDLRPTDSADIDEYFERLQENLREGQLRIVFFLEDSPYELRSVVDFLNRQMERSEVLLVEARQYTQAGLRIVAPTLFGYTEEARMVKRSVTTTSGARRRRWDRESFLADAAQEVEPEELRAMESLLDFALSLGCDVTYGTGIRHASYNIKDPSICPRSMISCWSYGELEFNLGWLQGSEPADRARTRLRELAAERLGVVVPEDSTGIPVRSEQWVPQVDAVKEILETTVREVGQTP